MSSRQKTQLLTTIQAARGAAAVAVVLCHVGTVLGARLHIQPFGGALRAGHAGVDFFFVLSGFIIASVHQGDIGRPSMLPRYAWRRLVRIYPVYWAATAIALGLAGAVGPDRLLTSLLLVPQHNEPVIGAAWTLKHEMLFYGMFGLLILNRAAGLAAFAAWLCFAAGLVPLATPELPWAPANLLTGFVGSSYNLQFGLGVVVAMLVARCSVPCPRALAVAGVVGLLLTGAAEDAAAIEYLGQVGRALFGVSAALVIGGMAAAECAGSIRAGRLPVFVGSASYAIYLIHVPLVMEAASLGLAEHLPVWIDAVALMTIGTGGGLALHLAVERPVLHALQGWWQRGSPVAPQSPR